MTTTANAFRRSFPEFGENSAYTDPVIDQWLAVAGELLNVSRWGGAESKTYELGKFLFCAHNLVMSRQAEAASQSGAPPGLALGVINNKSVDKVSVGYDTQAALEEGAGHWNLTTYGVRYIHMARMMGAGPLHVGVGSGFFDPLNSINAWPGPDTTPGQGNFS